MANMNTSDAVQDFMRGSAANQDRGDREDLVARLRGLGLDFLGPSDVDTGILEPMAESELLIRLAANSDPRLRMAVVPLLLMYPEWGSHAQLAVSNGEEPGSTQLRALYTGAVYAQRLWRTRLGFYLGPFGLLPDLYSVSLGLPPATERHGKTGLHALAEWQSSRTTFRFNWLASCQRMIELLFAQLKLRSAKQ